MFTLGRMFCGKPVSTPDQVRGRLFRENAPIGSPTRTRTWILRLTAGRPAVGRSGMKWWRQPVTLRPRRSCKNHLHPCAVPVIGAWGTYRACSSRFSVGCNDLICHPGVSLIDELELRAGLEPASTRFAGAAVAVPVTAT